VVTDLDVDLPRLCRVLRAVYQPQYIRPLPPQPFGPSGVSVELRDRAWKVGSVIVTQASHYGPLERLTGQGPRDWLHGSLAWVDHMPDYDDLVALKDAVFGPKRECYQVFPPVTRHVSIHDFALHLWGRADGTGVLPEFGEDGSI